MGKKAQRVPNTNDKRGRKKTRESKVLRDLDPQTRRKIQTRINGINHRHAQEMRKWKGLVTDLRREIQRLTVESVTTNAVMERMNEIAVEIAELMKKIGKRGG